jgi:hypothetical protein
MRAALITEPCQLIGDRHFTQKRDDTMLFPASPEISFDAATGTFDGLTHDLVDQMVASAAESGTLVATTPTRTTGPVTPSPRAQFAARVTSTSPTVVAEIGDGGAVLRDAAILMRLAASTSLPDAVRLAFPTVHASSPPKTPGPPPHRCGFLMEDLSTHETLCARLLRCEVPESEALAASIWRFLEPAYTAGRSNTYVDFGKYSRLYLEPIRERLVAATELRAGLRPDYPILLVRDGEELELPPWGQILRAVSQALERCLPRTRGFAHGNLTGWNLLLPAGGDGNATRMINPDDEVDDYAYDVGDLIMSLRHARFAATADLEPAPSVSTSDRVIRITYQLRAQPAAMRAAESTFAAQFLAFAERHRDTGAATRQQIATGAVLLRYLRRRPDDDQYDEHLALCAFAEGLRQLDRATRGS